MNTKYIIALVWVACLTMTTSSCREDSDYIPSYEGNSIDFQKASESFEEQFKAFWMAMNCNYPHWDYEAKYGLDWDAVYDKYLPAFQKLDKQRYLSSEEIGLNLKELYTEILSPLHDGHLHVEIQNLGNASYIYVIPQLTRLEERKAYYSDFLFSPNTFEYYMNVTSDNQVREHWGNATILDSQCWLFVDNILYFWFYSFETSFQFYDHEAYKVWFNKIQELYNAGTLKGLIIDLRGNPGGNASYHQYVLGAVQPYKTYDDGGRYCQVGMHRIKTGVGRFDFSQFIPFNLPAYQGEHAIITQQPIVLLVNSHTASMAEVTCVAAQQLENAIIIGTQTSGALSGLSPDYTVTYSGIIGEKNKTPFYAEIPSCTFITNDGRFLDSEGVKPDIEINFDRDLFINEGRDNQLERALEFIRTGK